MKIRNCFSKCLSAALSFAVIAAFLIAAGVVALGATRACAEDLPSAGDFQFGGLAREYSLHVPARYDGKTPVALVLVLHGAGGSGALSMKRDGWVGASDRYGFIVAGPDAEPVRPSEPESFLTNPRAWNDLSPRGGPAHRQVDDVGFIVALITRLSNQYRIDPKRIYVTGFSSGASMTLTLGVKLATRIAAIAPVSGQFFLGDTALAAPISMLYIIGTADPLNPIAGGETTTPWGPMRKPPIAKSIDAWRTMLKCPGNPVTMRNSGGVKGISYGPCAGGTVLEFFTVDGLGH
ncbi:MAG TPA: PHB depolymerase family esterase, partial [Candidatus Binataceae bacterium]|nr:PHB depolymerase family esterase [Candidatus Binataceae bacterium]